MPTIWRRIKQAVFLGAHIKWISKHNVENYYWLWESFSSPVLVIFVTYSFSDTTALSINNNELKKKEGPRCEREKVKSNYFISIEIWFCHENSTTASGHNIPTVWQSNTFVIAGTMAQTDTSNRRAIDQKLIRIWASFYWNIYRLSCVTLSAQCERSQVQNAINWPLQSAVHFSFPKFILFLHFFSMLVAIKVAMCVCIRDWPAPRCLWVDLFILCGDYRKAAC